MADSPVTAAMMVTSVLLVCADGIAVWALLRLGARLGRDPGPRLCRVTMYGRAGLVCSRPDSHDGPHRHGAIEWGPS